MNEPAVPMSEKEVVKQAVGSAVEQSIAAEARSIGLGIDSDVVEEAEESLMRETATYAVAKLQRMDIKNQRRRDNNELRKAYADKAYKLASYSVWVWSFLFIGVAIANSAAGKQPLSDQALMVLTAGATVNVLAAFLAIIRGLFPTKISK